MYPFLSLKPRDDRKNLLHTVSTENDIKCDESSNALKELRMRHLRVRGGLPFFSLLSGGNWNASQ